jgi:uncharacterized protein with GYD domain
MEASRKLLAEAGGSLESFHFALGQDDAYIICDLPDNVTVAAVSMSAAPAACWSAAWSHCSRQRRSTVLQR